MHAMKMRNGNVFDVRAVAAAESTADLAIADALSATDRPRGIVVTAPAGAGKSHLVCTAVAKASKAKLRVAVAAPTNEQAFGLVRTISQLYCTQTNGRRVTFVPASDITLPDPVRRLNGVQEMAARDANGEEIIVGTVSKLGDAFTRGSLSAVDLLLMDESYQADSGKYFGLAGLAPVHLLVGDGGQISPFSTIADPGRWRGLPEDPLQTAVGVIRRNHPRTPVYGLPITRRLDGRAARVAKYFYPGLAFSPAVLPGVRELRLSRIASKDGRFRKLDEVLHMAAHDGWAHVELPPAPVLRADNDAIELLAAMMERLFGLDPRVRCERQPRLTQLQPRQVAVGVSHNDQKDLLRVTLDARGLGDVVVETANKLQGLEFEVVFVWHPLSGLQEPDGFHFDPGRLCVLLTRHRHACIIVGRVTDRDLLKDQPPPSTVAYLGWDPDPMLDGWTIHGEVFDALKPYRIFA